MHTHLGDPALLTNRCIEYVDCVPIAAEDKHRGRKGRWDVLFYRVDKGGLTEASKMSGAPE